ncbi:helix-turn-helix domain-containing protein [Acrocarpospora pleiomorpha]|nr:helix-turn-helix transcriptional regulator [Acrocarpospora pleiomorpha]
MTLSAEADELAARLRALKERAGVSFEELAGRTGIGRSSLHRYAAGTKIPADFAVVHTFAKGCGASGEETRDLHRLWALADAARRGESPPPLDEPEEPVHEPEEPRRERGRTPWIITIAASAAAVASAAVALVLVFREDGPAGSAKTVPIKVFNVEVPCQNRTDRPPSCSMGLAIDPRAKYDANNVVSHRVWHNDVLECDCVLYDGDLVSDETGVFTKRWYRVRLDDVPGGVAWLPAVRTQDYPKVPTCA